VSAGPIDPDELSPAGFTSPVYRAFRDAGLVSRRPGEMSTVPRWAREVLRALSFDPACGDPLLNAFQKVLSDDAILASVRALVREGAPLRAYLISIGAIAEDSDPDREVER
jgi:hypothetical protein